MKYSVPTTPKTTVVTLEIALLRHYNVITDVHFTDFQIPI